jgi:hypothetical protein
MIMEASIRSKKVNVRIPEAAGAKNNICVILEMTLEDTFPITHVYAYLDVENALLINDGIADAIARYIEPKKVEKYESGNQVPPDDVGGVGRKQGNNKKNKTNGGRRKGKSSD